MTTFGGNNTLYSRSEAVADLPAETFPHRQPCGVHRSIELICVAVAYLTSLFLNVRPQAEVEEVQNGDGEGQKSLGQNLMLTSN